MSKNTYIIDLDHTICYPNLNKEDSFERYGMALPNKKMIKALQKLKKQGHKIIIFTARRTLTHNNNIAAIIKDVGELTTRWLSSHKVPYDEIRWGKPYGVYYVDDKAIRPDEFIEMVGQS